VETKTGRKDAMITRLFSVVDGILVGDFFESVEDLNPRDMEVLRYVVSEPSEPLLTTDHMEFKPGSVVPIGPRIAIATPHSSNAVSGLQATCVKGVVRAERVIFHPTAGMSAEEIQAKHLDVMTQQVYPLEGITTFDSGIIPAPVRIIDVLGRGEQALREINVELGLAMDDADIVYYTSIFRKYNRNPTDVELVQIGNCNSEHSRHQYFKGIQVIDGIEMPMSLLDMIQRPLQMNWRQSSTVMAFDDNVGACHGFLTQVFVPIDPTKPSGYKLVLRWRHATDTAETHCHPTKISPYPGSATGIGGRLRDNNAGGRGSFCGGGFSGYEVLNLFIPGYQIPGEVCDFTDKDNPAWPNALRLLLEAIAGCADHGNQYGEPNLGGIARTFAQRINKVCYGFAKPNLYVAGNGWIDAAHVQKHEPEKGMLIVAIGGPAYPIGLGGGAASSMVGGQNTAKLDFASVQRGNGEMQCKTAQVIRDCVDMLDDNPTEAIHDQGAGGQANDFSEIVGALGGRADIRKITLGDKTMPVMAIWNAEYQERYVVLVKTAKFAIFEAICKRRCVNCEVLGEITGDGKITVIDSKDGTKPVEFEVKDILGKLPQKTFKSKRVPLVLPPADLPKDLTVRQAAEMVLKQVSVGSKSYIVDRKDHSVTGLVAQSQACGPNQLPIADFGVLADSYFGFTGQVGTLGEQPLKVLVNTSAGIRMTFAEALCNMMGAGGIKIDEIHCRLNWMWAAKLEGQGPLLYDAVETAMDAMITTGIKPTGGKDSLSFASKANGEMVIGPGTLVLKINASMPDIRKKLTPDIKQPGESCLGLISLGRGKNRLGGSALLQALNQIGNESPDCEMSDIPKLWNAIQILHSCGALLSIHDVSDGGLFTTVAEMCMASSCGITTVDSFKYDVPTLFAEEAGAVVEFRSEDKHTINRVLEQQGAPEITLIGCTTGNRNPRVFGIDLPAVRKWWEATGHAIKRIQIGEKCADEEYGACADLRTPKYNLCFTPEKPIAIDGNEERPKVAILHTEGTNGHVEMAAAFYTAGLDPISVDMTDLLEGRATLDDFQGLVTPGGFANMDVFGAGRLWSAAIKFNADISAMFERFCARGNTWTLGVCNGAQTNLLLGLAPMKGLDLIRQPRFVKNLSGKFEARWARVMIPPNPSILFKGMAGSILGIHVAHGEGRAFFPDPKILDMVRAENLAPLVYVDPDGNPTGRYPDNPNGSVDGITALTTPDGRNTVMMPHWERAFRMIQWGYIPPESPFSSSNLAPWIQIGINARKWCLEHRA
jgi:phosphoribosylformylglycinamidine synthase